MTTSLINVGCAFFFLLFSFQVHAQDIELSGTVISNGTGAALSGVSILAKETNRKTTTDINGAYTLSVSSNNTIIIFSLVGYETLETTITSQTTINVSLVSNNKTSDEVAVGYGTQRTIYVTGSIGFYQSSDTKIRPMPIISPDQLLVGQGAEFMSQIAAENQVLPLMFASEVTQLDSMHPYG